MPRTLQHNVREIAVRIERSQRKTENAERILSRRSQQIGRTPTLAAVADDAPHAGVVGDITVAFRIRVNKTLGAAQMLEIVLFTGQEQPARAGLDDVFGVFLQPFHAIQLRLQGNRIEKNILAHAVADQVLHLAQVETGGQAASFGTGHHKKIQQHDAVTHQVVVKVESLARMGDQWHVGQHAALCGAGQRP